SRAAADAMVADAEASGHTAKVIERPVEAGSANYVIWDEAAISEPTTLYQDALPDNATTEQLRERIAELEKELRTDGLTGLRNWRAFTEDETLGWSEVASFDLDGL